MLFLLFVGYAFSQFFLKASHELYNAGDIIRVKVRKLGSSSGLPYDYYNLPYCHPDPKPEEQVENLGELLFGDRIKTTVFNLPFKSQISCQEISKMRNTACRTLDTKLVKKFRGFIKDRYFIQMEADSLPVASLFTGSQCGYKGFDSTLEKIEYENVDGFDVGCYVAEFDKYYLNNHFSFNIKYHEEKDGASIIAVEVVPSSIKHKVNSTCVKGKSIPSSIPRFELLSPEYLDKLSKSVSIDPIFSYSVNWQAVDQRWSSRWDNYVQSKQTNIHWYSIVNSCLIVIFLSGMIAMIMIRILHKDISRYNLISEDDDDEPDERGWKLVHGEVFRPPKMKAFFTILLGSGIQILGMLICTLPVAALGIFSVSNRGYFFSAMILCYFLMGLPAGFFSLRFYKMFEGENWKITTLLVALFFPTMLFVNFSALNLFVKIGANSSIAIPFLQLIVLFLLWVGIYIPLVFLGATIGFKRKKVPLPCEVAKFPRLIPPQPWYMKSFFTVGLGGIMPFGAVFVELYFVMTSVWMHKLFFFFGFIFLIFVILLIVTSEITIILIYLQLCNEDYRWWWRSFITGGFGAVYIFLFSVYYFTSLHPGSFWLAIVFFEYMALISGMFFVLLGTCGFISTLMFIKRIYSSIRID